MSEHRYLTTDEIAERLRETRENVSRRCSAGQIPAKKIGGEWRIREADFEAFMAPSNVVGSPRKRSTLERPLRGTS